MKPLKWSLHYLTVLLKTFGVHSPKEECDVFSLGDGITPFNSVNVFLQICVREAKAFPDFSGQPSD